MLWLALSYSSIGYSMKQNELFSVKSVVPHIIFIIAIIGTYYFLSSRDLFPQWIDYIYYGGKALIALIIILASARSAVMPILSLLSGLLILFLGQIYDYDIVIVSPADAWQLLVIAFIGLIITILVKC